MAENKDYQIKRHSITWIDKEGTEGYVGEVNQYGSEYACKKFNIATKTSYWKANLDWGTFEFLGNKTDFINELSKHMDVRRKDITMDRLNA